MNELDFSHLVSPDSRVRDTKPILEDSLRPMLSQLSDDELERASEWSNSWTTDHVSAVKRWVARGPINDEIDRRRSHALFGHSTPSISRFSSSSAPLSLPEA